MSLPGPNKEVPKKRKQNNNSSGVTKKSKADKYESKWSWFRSLGPRAKYICSPMVGQSELAFRMLCRQHGVGLCYTPMFISSLFVESEEYRERIFTTCPEDRPLIVQFCGNNPQTLLQAALLVQDRCDAVDLNLGCPQEVAKRGGYGAHMMKDWIKIDEILRTLVRGLKVPVTCKIRIFDEYPKTLAYAKVCQDAGVSLITVHGRQVHEKEEVLANWSVIARLKQDLQIPVIANGDMWHVDDVRLCRDVTLPDGFMSAQGLLHNPALFEPLPDDPQAEVLAARLAESGSTNTQVATPPSGSAASGSTKSTLSKYLKNNSHKKKPAVQAPAETKEKEPPRPPPVAAAGPSTASSAPMYMRRRRQVGPTTNPTLCFSFSATAAGGKNLK
jgi:tRNA-dihydrouridine synthase